MNILIRELLSEGVTGHLHAPRQLVMGQITEQNDK